MKILRFLFFLVLIVPALVLCTLGMTARGAAWAFMVGWKAPQTFKEKKIRAQEIEELEAWGRAHSGPDFR